MLARQAVLGALVERRGYGYQLVHRLEERLGPNWQLKPSSVYAALDQLEARGLAVAVGEPSTELRRGPQRVVYEASDAGHVAFAEWVSQPSVSPEPVRSELALKVGLARREHARELLEMLGHEERLLRERRDETAVECKGTGPDWPSGAAALVRAAALGRVDAELKWIAAAREALEALAAGASAPTARAVERLLRSIS